MTYSDVQTALVPSMRGYLGYRPFPCQLLQQCIDITLYGGSVLWGHLFKESMDQLRS